MLNKKNVNDILHIENFRKGEEKMKKQNGMSLVMLIIVIIAVIVVGGVGALALRAVITGEEFLAPIEEFFGAEEADDEDEDEEKEEKENKKDEEVDVEEDDEEENNKKEEDDDKTEVSKNGVVHYRGEIDFDDYTGGETLEYSEYIKMTADFYASETELEKIVFEFNLKDFLEKYYEAYESDMSAAGYTYESFRDLMMGTFETSFTSGFESSGSIVEDYFKVEFPKKEIMVMTITEEGIVNIYENYGIKEGDSVKEILEGFEDALNIELKEV